MTKREAIAQLRSLIENSRSSHSEDGDIWERDIEALTVAIEALSKTEWISVKDRLPTPTSRALVLNKHGEMMVGTYSEWGWMFPYWFDKLTHWMPLPEPPEVSEDE